MDLSAGRGKISGEERAKRFTDARCLYSGGLNYRAADCVAKKKAPTLKAAGAEVKKAGIGKLQVNSRRMALQLTEKVCFECFKMVSNFAIISYQGGGIGTINGRDSFSYNLHIDCE